MGAGWSVLGGSVAHTVFARQTARDIGWESNGFQYEVGFASFAMGLGGIYASTVDQPGAWVTASIASGLFLLLPESTTSSRSCGVATMRPARR